MERRAVLPTHRPPSQKASIAWLIVVICTIGAALLAVMVAAQDASAQSAPDPDAGWFQRCALTKTGAFDPIVFPGTPAPVGHRHLFFGSTAISPTSTTVSDLQAGSSTCLFQADSNAAKVFADGAIGGNYSSYWVPDLLVRNGNWVGDKPLDVNVTQLTAYYKKGASSIDPQKVEPFPSGLRMVIRDRNDSKTNVKWYCSSTNGEGNNGIFRERPYDCDTSTPYKSVTARITFPQCGDGRLDDSTDHISHMVYAGDNGCPKDHPRVFPRLFIHAKYDTSLGANSKLAPASGDASSDPATGFHADYIEAWQPGTLQYFVDHCIHAGINCRDGDRLP